MRSYGIDEVQISVSHEEDFHLCITNHIRKFIRLGSEVKGHEDGPQLGRSKIRLNVLITMT